MTDAGQPLATFDESAFKNNGILKVNTLMFLSPSAREEIGKELAAFLGQNKDATAVIWHLDACAREIAENFISLRFVFSQVGGCQSVFSVRSLLGNFNNGRLSLPTLLSVPRFRAILCRNPGKNSPFRTRNPALIPHPHPPHFWRHDCPEKRASRGFSSHRVLKIFLFFFGCMPSTCVLLSPPSLGRNASRHRKMAGPLKSLEFEVSGQ